MTAQDNKFKIDTVYKNELLAQSKDLIKIWNFQKDGHVLYNIATVHDTLAYYDEAQSDTEEILSENHEVLRDYVLSIKEVISRGLLDFSKNPCYETLFDLNEAFMVLERVDEEELFFDDIAVVEKAISKSLPAKLKTI